jgi:ABC-type molybdate transport system substrate-binding protein
MLGRLISTVVALAAMTDFATAADSVILYAAGSLRSAMSEIAAAFEAGTGIRVEGKYGASGTLRNEIADGARADVFASANMEHPQALAALKRSGPVVMFAKNQLCALVRPGLPVTNENLLDRMLDEEVKVGTSTPRTDPSGDYAWEVFRKADRIRPGSFSVLEKKAQQLVGGPDAPAAPPGGTVYGMLLANGRTDMFLTYCTNANEALRENPGFSKISLPDPLAVGASYGLTVLNSAPVTAYRFAMYILSADGQRVLAKFGFFTPTLP